MSRKLVIDKNNVVINIITDQHNVVNNEMIISDFDETVGIGDTVNDDGSLRQRRLDFYIPTAEEIEEENRKRAELERTFIVNDLKNKV